MYQVDYLLHHPFFPQKEKLNVDRLSTHCPVEVEITLKGRPQWGFFLFVCLIEKVITALPGLVFRIKTA